MDLGMVGTYGLLMTGGLALGTLLNVLRPRDREAAATYRRQARRAVAVLPDRWRTSRSALPDGVGQVGHPLRRLRADRLESHARRVHALEEADPGAEQHG